MGRTTPIAMIQACGVRDRDPAFFKLPAGELRAEGPYEREGPADVMNDDEAFAATLAAICFDTATFIPVERDVL